ncbi:protein of unknown function [Paraburkholderia dioscoreae]|uniref:Uncharacterized protein n=1 Tax=Paraburkholderia dioscoreae TaxID=2604047 RepID=A0A5Q4ZDQ2_9BURK|nr:protein of unknown function [Paraburkholderia dioscoreae]
MAASRVVWAVKSYCAPSCVRRLELAATLALAMEVAKEAMSESGKRSLAATLCTSAARLQAAT